MTDRARLRQSMRNFKRLLSLEPGHLGHLEQLARISAELGRPRDAAKYLLRRAEALRAQGAVDAALADLRAAQQFDPRNKRAARLEKDVVASRPRTPAPAPVQRAHPPAAAVDGRPAGPPPDPPPRSAPMPVLTPPPRLEPTISLADLGSPPPLLAQPEPEPDEVVYDAASLLAVHELEEVEEVQPIEVVVYRTEGSIEAALPDVDDRPTLDLSLDEEPTYTPDPTPALVPREVDYSALPTLDVEPMPDESVGDGSLDLSDFADAPDAPDGSPAPAAVLEERRTVPFAAIRHSRALIGAGTIDLDDEDDDVAEIDMSPAPLLAPPEATTPVRAKDPDTELSPAEPEASMPVSVLLAGVPEDRVAHLREVCSESSVVAGETVAAAAQRFSGVYLVLSGTLAMVRDDTEDGALFVAEPGDIVGLVEAFRGGPWRHEVVARTPARLLRITTNQLADLRRRYPRIERAMTEEAEHREGLFLVAGSRLFRALSDEAQGMLASHLEPRNLIPGEILFTAGAPAGGLYLVAGGALSILHWGRECGRLGAGDCLGVLAALGGGAAHATARAASPTEVFRLDRTMIPPLLEDPAVRAAFERVADVRRVTLGA